MMGTVLKPCPGQAGLHGTVAHTACCVFQDELSHINARLNMGILGCEYPHCGLGWVWGAQGALLAALTAEQSSPALPPSPGSPLCSL